MKRINEIFNSRRSVIQFIKFGLVGMSNTILGFSIYYLLLLLNINYLVSNLISWVVSVFNAFFWNDKYVFNNESTWLKKLFRTYVSYGVSLFVSTLLLFVLVKWCNVSEIIAPIICLVITIPLNFFLNKFWTFR